MTRVFLPILADTPFMTDLTELTYKEITMADRCETCKFWLSEDDDPDEGSEGSCCRYPPVAFSAGNWGYHPMVMGCDWCGEYQIDLKKVSEK